MPLRVLLVDHAPIVGGVEIMIKELLTGLDPEHVAPTIVTDAHSPMRGQFSKTYPEIPITLTRLKGNVLAPFTWLQSAWQLAQTARKTQAQVIQTFTARTHLISALAGPLAGVPVVWRLNDDTLYRPLAAWAGRVPRRIISVSAHLRTHYKGVLRVTDLIPDGVPQPPLPTQAEARTRLNLPAEGLLVVLVARLVRWKGQTVLIDALAQLAAQYPPLRVALVGGWSAADEGPGPLGGGETYLHELEEQSKALGVRDRVLFVGHSPNPGMYLAAADIVAHTSLQPEPFGRGIVEGMAAGRPVVAIDAGGPAEIVQPEVTGLLIPPNNAKALAAALQRLLSDADLRARLGQQGQARAQAEYALPQMAQRFTQVWQAVAKQR